MAGIVIIEFEKSGGGTVNNADHHVPTRLDENTEKPTIIFVDPDAPNGGIDNTNQPFPTGMDDSESAQTPEP